MNVCDTAGNQDLMRLFVGCRFDATTREALAARQEGCLGMRWVLPETMHITLSFLGKVRKDKVAPLKEALATVRAGGLTVRQGRVAWHCHGRRCLLCVNIENTPELDALHKDVLAALETVLGPREEKPFRPHVTIGRGQRDQHPTAEEMEAFTARWADKPGIVLPVSSFQLIHSVLKPAMPEHTVLATFPLD